MVRRLVLSLVVSLVAGAVQGAPVSLLHNGSVQGVLGPPSGGVQARTLALVAAERERRPDLVLVSCGNMLGPSVTSEVDGGLLALELMNRSGYDAMAVGPHDFFAGAPNLLDRARSARFPFVATNLTATGSAAELDWSPLVPSAVIERHGRRVLVLGVIEPSAVANWPRWTPGLVVTPVVEALEAARRGHEPVDATVVLGTMTFPAGLAILDALPWVDCVVAHPAAGETVPTASTFSSTLVDGRVLVWSACHGANLASLEIEPRDGRASVLARPMAVTEDQAEDADAAAAIAALEDEARRASGTVVATLSPSELAAYPRTLVDGLRTVMGAEVGVIHAGALRLPSPPPQVSRRTLRATFPFPDRVAVLDVDGATLRRVYERRNEKLINDAGLEVAGMESRDGRVTVNGRPLDPTERYRVATTEFLALGGLGLFPASPSAVGSEALVDVLERHFGAGPDALRQARVRHGARRPILRTKTTLDASFNRLDFTGSAPAYQYSDPAAVYTGSDIPGLVGVEHRQYSYALRHRRVVDRPDSDLTLDLDLAYSTFKDFKTIDRGKLGVTYEAESPDRRPHLFGAFDLTGTLRDPDVEGRDHPLFARLVGGLVWNTARGAKVFLGAGRLFRLSQPGDPGNTGLELRFEVDRRLAAGVEFSSHLDVFASFDDDSVRMIDWPLSLRCRLAGRLSTVLRYTLFSWDDDAQGDAAGRRELFMGLGYSLAGRRF